MLGAFRRQAKKILIVRAEHSGQGDGPSQMVAIGSAQLTEIARRYGVDAGGTELAPHFRRHVLIEIEAERAHPVVERPCSSSFRRHRSA